MDKGLHIESRLCLAAIALTFVHRPSHARAAIERFLDEAGSPRASAAASAETAIRAFNGAVDWAAAERSLRWAERPGHHILFLCDPSYPLLLKQIAQPPPMLFVAGDPATLRQPQVAVVGSRRATHYGTNNARDIAAALVRAGFVVTSGLALGIDAAAHRATLSAGGNTVAVLGAGIDCDYPKAHRELRQSIAAAGALVSEFPLGSVPKPHHFPRRNRIISGLALATIVVEAAAKSGSLSTATHALEQNRSVFAVPGSIRNPLAVGCHRLLSEGADIVADLEQTALALLEIGANSYPEMLSAGRPKAINVTDRESAARRADGLSEQEHTVMNCIEWEPVGYDDVVERSGLTSSELSAILSTLEIKGLIRAIAGSCYVRAK